jgi:dolichol-phosphate mannosyltransferase
VAEDGRDFMTGTQLADQSSVGNPSRDTLAIIPTYNERENLPAIVTRIHRAHPDVHILIVDDGSPDGTGQIADSLALADSSRIHVLHRFAKQGLGAAYLAGFAWGLSRAYSVFVEIDADGSHPPEHLHRLLDAIDAGAELAIGSRYVSGGEIRNWSWKRKTLSRIANLYTRSLLSTDVGDITAGYRAYRREVLEKIDLSTVSSRGYCFQIDLTWRTILNGFCVAEVPISFVERELGQSKMSEADIREAMVKVLQWSFKSRFGRERGRENRAARPAVQRTR